MRRIHVLRSASVLLLAACTSLLMADGPNLVRNGDFSALDDDGLPAHWEMTFEGDGVEGSTSMVEGPEGKAALRSGTAQVLCRRQCHVLAPAARHANRRSRE